VLELWVFGACFVGAADRFPDNEAVWW